MNEELQSDLSPEQLRRLEQSPLFNADLAPISSSHRRWGTFDIANLWVGHVGVHSDLHAGQRV
jgi:cytosine/uracil/thiamine/allantoin permease